MQELNFGINAIGLTIPKYALPLEELGASYFDNLGCKAMSLCGPDENVATLAITAAQRALANWGGDLSRIGLIVVATETGLDMSRPLSSWVMDELGIKGFIRSYEVKHACYGGTVAVRQALEWKLSGSSNGKAALVIAADVSMYAPGHSGEPTQGAGAIAMIIDQPLIATINMHSYCWSESQFDFWRPVGNKYPEVNGRLSLTSYINAVIQCFRQLAGPAELASCLDTYQLMSFHVPFPKMVFKAVQHLGKYCNWSTEDTLKLYTQRILPTMQWNQQIGNNYTASLWFAVANAVTKLAATEQFTAFSYGSGCGAELLTLECTTNQANSAWAGELLKDFARRETIDAQTYKEFRNSGLITKQGIHHELTI